ncbi:MAG: signal peptidase I [Turneriella sp.]
MIQKARHYRASGKGGTRKWKRYALIAAFILSIALVLQFAFRHLFFYPLRIATDSMQPEIATGDKRYFTYPRLALPKPGDIVLIRLANADVQLLCRIIATDGDKVMIREGRLYINGQEKRTLNFSVKAEADLAYQLAETEVRPNYVFCLNDNARNTNDSRLHGSFARQQIEAVLVQPALFF